MGGLLSDQFDLSVVLKIAAQGGAKTTQEVTSLQDAVDELARTDKNAEKVTRDLTNSLSKLDGALKGSVLSTKQAADASFKLADARRKAEKALDLKQAAAINRAMDQRVVALQKEIAAERELANARNQSRAATSAGFGTGVDSRLGQKPTGIKASDTTFATQLRKEEADAIARGAFEAEKSALALKREGDARQAELSGLRAAIQERNKYAASKTSDSDSKAFIASERNALAIDQSDKARKAELATMRQSIQERYKDADATTKSTDSFNSQRYALYEVAAAYGAVSAGLIGLGASAISAFAEMESGFTKVERTSGLYGAAFAPLQEDLLSLGRAIPTVTSEIQDLAARGAQMGIATSEIEGFTEVMAKFIATSPEVDVNSVAESFGRLSNLTGVKDFEALASAVAQVGVNSAATDPQIIKTTQEMARAVSSTSLAADEIIGLAAAFASLGVAPEASRGVMNQFFTQLDKGAAGLNDSMSGAAQVIGVTEAQARSLFQTDAGAFFTQFVDGLSEVDNITVALDDMGLQGQRLLPTFKALAADSTRNAAGQSVLAKALRDSNQGFVEKTELERQYAPIADDLASKQIILANSVKELAFTLVSEFGPAIKLFVDGLTAGVQALTDFTSNPIGAWVMKTVVVLGALVAAYTTLRTVIALATAFQMAFTTATGAGVASGLIGSLQGLIAAYKGTATTANVAATGVTRLKGALLLLGKATVVIGVVQGLVFALSDIPGTAVNAGNTLIGLGNIMQNVANRLGGFLHVANALTGGLLGNAGIGKGLTEAGASLKKWGNSQKKASDETANLGNLLGGLNDTMLDVADATGSAGSGLDDLGGSAANAAEEIRTVVDYANDLQEVFSRAFELEFGNLKAQDAVTKTFNDLRNKAAEAEQKIKDIRTSIRGLMADIGILQSDIGTQEYFLSIALEYGDTKRAAEIQANLAKIQADLAAKQNDLTKAQDDLTKAQDANSKTLVGNSDQAIANRETVIGLVESYQAQLVALAKSGASQEELRKKSEQLRQDFIRQAVQLGFNREELYKYETSFVNLTAVIAQVPRNVSTNMEITGLSAAEAALREFAAKSATLGAQAGGNFKNGFGGAAGQVVPGPQIVTPPPTPWKSWEAMRQYFSQNIFSKLATNSGRSLWDQLVKSGYSGGGYTGPGGKHQPAGIVHKGEYVIPKRDVNQSTGLPRADALGKLTRGSQPSGGYAGGGFVQGGGLSGPVDLSAGSIQQLARVLQTQISVDGKIIGEAASRSYAADNRVGAN